MVERKVKARPVLVLLAAAYVVVLFRTAWVCDDAYITFRTVENFLEGYGLRYNPSERVQTYTHPLWLFAFLPFRVLSGEVYGASLALSMACSLAAVALMALVAARDLWNGALGLVLLLSSKSFVDYSTSGLENPLAHLLLALFFLVYSKKDLADRDRLALYLLASCVALTRTDLCLILIPALLDVFRHKPLVRQAITGFLPLLLWEAFSILYYGFPFPNTAYAKLGAGISRLDLIEQGGRYFLGSLATDPLALTVLGAAFVWVALERHRQSGLTMLGVALYLGYVLVIGGDFMAGRFFSAATFVAVLTLVQRVSPTGWVRPASFAVAIALGLAAPEPPILSGAEVGSDRTSLRVARGITDERAYYYPYTGLLRAGRRTPPSHPWAHQGAKANAAGETVVFRDTVGFFGYAAGPTVHVVDVYALTDALLARLPARHNPNWRPGHLARAIPAGYAESLASSANELDDEALSHYYGKLRAITRGALFTSERWRAILGMNLGAYSEWIDVERYRYWGRERVRLTELTFDRARLRNLDGAGVRIELGRKRREGHIELGLDCDDHYELRFFRADEIVSTIAIPPICDEGDVVPRTITVPPEAHGQGYDVLWILPMSGSRPYQLTHVHLLR